MKKMIRSLIFLLLLNLALVAAETEPISPRESRSSS